MRSFSSLSSALFTLTIFLHLAVPASAAARCGLKRPRDAQYPMSDGGGGGDNGNGNGDSGGSGGSGPSNSTSDGNGGSESSGGGSDVCAKNKVATAWYTGWHASQFGLDKVSWDKYTMMTYAFATTTDDPDELYLSDGDKALLPNFVKAAHSHNVKASLSLGGWGGSQYFSTAVASDSNRTEFVNTIVKLVTTYDLDGIDFDWEFPNRIGAGNTNAPTDSARLLDLLTELRATKEGKDLVLTAAVSTEPFAGENGAPMADVSAFAKVLDFVAIMNYDIYGSFDPRGPGPNAPLNDTCADTQAGSAVSALWSWTQAKFPQDQLVLGIASYGHTLNLTNAAAHSYFPDLAVAGGGAPLGCDAFKAGVQDGYNWDGTMGSDACGLPVPSEGYYNFVGLVEGGYLGKDGMARKGNEYRLDSCSQTPYIYSPATQLMVTYDDPESMKRKGQFIRNNGMLGFAMWEAATDYNDVLIDSIKAAMKC